MKDNLITLEQMEQLAKSSSEALSADEKNHQEAYDAINQALEDEATAREEADTALDGRIDDEVKARQQEVYNVAKAGGYTGSAEELPQLFAKLLQTKDGNNIRY